MQQDSIIIQGLRQNNLKNVSLKIPKGKIVVFTGVSGSGKSSIVFDTIAAESQRQMNETYTAFMRGRLPKYEKPRVERIDNLSASVIVDQSRLGGNARSTVGTISDLYAALRLLYSRIGTPYVGTASYFSFNDPNGMCPECSGIGKVMTVDIEGRIDPEKTWNEGMADLPAFHGQEVEGFHRTGAKPPALRRGHAGRQKALQKGGRRFPLPAPDAHQPGHRQPEGGLCQAADVPGGGAPLSGVPGPAAQRQSPFLQGGGLQH